MANFKLLKNTALYSIGEILPRAISFLLLPVYTLYLSPSDYGVISYTQSIIIFLYVLGAFALNTYVLRFYFIHEDEEKRKVLLGTIHIAILGMNIIILMLAFIIMPSVIQYYHLQVPWNPFFRLAFIINFLDSLSIIPLVVYRIRQDAVKFITLGLSRTILIVVLTLYLVAFLKQGLLGFYHAQLYVLVPYSLIYFAVMKKYALWQINWKYLKEGMHFSAPLIPGVICYQLLSVSDRIILERYVGISELGIYNVASQFALVLNIIINSGYRAIEPELFRRYGHFGFFEFIRKTQGFFFFSIFTGALALCLFSQEVFCLMTSAPFHRGYLLVPALVVGVIMTGQNVIYGGILQGEKRTKVQGGATLMGAIISVTLNILLIPIWGTYAAAMNSAISFFLMNTLLFWAMTYPGKTMVRETILVFLVPGISYLLFYFLGEISILGIVIKVIILLSYLFLASKLLHVDLAGLKFVLLKHKFF